MQNLKIIDLKSHNSAKALVAKIENSKKMTFCKFENVDIRKKTPSHFLDFFKILQFWILCVCSNYHLIWRVKVGWKVKYNRNTNKRQAPENILGLGTSFTVASLSILIVVSRIIESKLFQSLLYSTCFHEQVLMAF